MGLVNLSLPFNGPVSSPFGRRWLELPGQLGFWNEHEGCDWARGMGVAVRAAGDGVVYDNVFTSLKGNQLGIQHAGDYRTRYHMLRDKALFKVGQQVRAGDIIGYVGMSGTAATGPHLHFELHYNKKPINPTLSLTYDPAILAGNTSKPFPEGDEDMSQADVDWIKANLQTVLNSINDDKIGILKNAAIAADKSSIAADQSRLAAERAESAVQHLAGVGGVKNTLNDDKTGVWPQVNRIATNVDAIKKALESGVASDNGTVTITLAQKDYDAIAAATVNLASIRLAE